MQSNASADSSEFGFLDAYDPMLRIKLHEAMSLVEDRYFGTSLGVSRAFCELLLYQIAKKTSSPQQQKNEKGYDFVNRLFAAGHIPLIHANEFHFIREKGNDEVHAETLGTEEDAKRVLTSIKALAHWFENQHSSSTRPSVAAASSLGVRAPPPPSASASLNVIDFPKRDNNQTPLPSERSSPPNLGQYQRPNMESVPESRRWGGALAGATGLTIAALIGWHYWSVSSRFKPQLFPQAQAYLVVPGGNAAHVNERGGPGTNYPVLGQLDRGSTVAGIGRAFDAENVSWIELADGQGYVKETLLSPAVAASQLQTPAPAPPPVSVAPASMAAGGKAASPFPNSPSPGIGGAMDQQDADAAEQIQATGAERRPSIVPALFGLALGILAHGHDTRRGAFNRPPSQRQYRAPPQRFRRR